jgi:hypothetical protein
MPDASWELRCLDFHARVHGPAAVVERIARGRPVAPAWAVSASSGAVVELTIRGSHVLRDGQVIASASRRSELLPLVERALNAAAVDHLGRRYVLLHAGAVARQEVGLLMPAASGSGKSTLVAGLVAAGFAYLSDEVAILDPHSGRLLPFANSLGIKAGGRRLFGGRYPELAGIARRRVDGRAVWPLPPPERAWPRAPVRVGVIVLPRYRPASQPRLSPIGRSAALAACVAQTSRLQAHGPTGLRALVALVRGAECYSLRCGDLAASLDALQTAVAASRSRRTTQ